MNSGSVCTNLCEGKGCGHPAQAQGRSPSGNMSALRGETSKDPVDGVSSLHTRSGGQILGERHLTHAGEVELGLTCSNQAVKPALCLLKVIYNQWIRTAEQIQQHKEVLEAVGWRDS